MSLVKTSVRKKNRTTSRKVKKSNKTKSACKQEIIQPAPPAFDCGIELTLETSPRPVNSNEILVEGWDLSDSLLPLTVDNQSEPTANREIEPDDCNHFQIVGDATYQSLGNEGELVDPSKWFEHNDADFAHEAADQQQNIASAEASSAACTRDLEVRSDDAITVAACSSPGENQDQISEKGLESSSDTASEPFRVERRRHPRQESSDLVWVEYFNSAMESIGKEAARVDNVGAGGMRVTVKAAPADLEKVIVSYPFRGFESCAIVRGRYQAENGQEHLCMEFADKGWIVSTPCTAQGRIEQDNPRRKILLADDDSTFRKILGDILHRAGYEVVLAEDGEKALEKATSENPDLVITDGLMPKLHGFDVCKAVKALNPATRVIMLTAIYTSPSYRWEAHHKFQVDELITKPCQMSDLLLKIEKHMPPLGQVA